MIDTHQHLLYPARFRYAWTADLPALQGNFRLEEYCRASEGCGIEGTIFMEADADESAGEAAFFCRLAQDPANKILGVIAAARPENTGFEDSLDSITHPALKGIRRVLHTQPDNLSQSAAFRANIARLGERGLTFDLCFAQRQLGLALDLVRACPGTTFILDHCAVPDIVGNDAPHGGGFKTWAAAIGDLARLPHVNVKISGLTTCAPGHRRNVESLAPYVNTVLEAFGPARCLWGGDWPVVNLGSGLAGWCELTISLLAGLSHAERNAVFRENAQRVYLMISGPEPRTVPPGDLVIPDEPRDAEK
jgi:predicted TIM-barrel fold metal-dependent hydrolase